MRTPAGKECSYFFGDYFRGRDREECRLLSGSSPPITWNPQLCETCPVPDIQIANACTYMELGPSLGRPLPFMKSKVRVSAYCNKTDRSGFDPHIGCGECHRLPPVFTGEDS